MTMSCMYYNKNELYIEEVSLKTLAEKFGTPLYVYSRRSIETNWRNYDDAFAKTPHLVCYAVKANSNIAILNLLARLHSGFDIVSKGELERVLAANGDPQKVVFSGVGKSRLEIQYAIEKNIYCFNVESFSELEIIEEIASRHNKRVNIALRINPDIAARTHSHIVTGSKVNKFGIDIDEIVSLARNIQNMSSLKLIGLACHIGSQITDLYPLMEAVNKLHDLYLQIKELGIELELINVGGGLGIVYHNEKPPAVDEYVNAIKEKFNDSHLKIITEPGRAIVGNAGVLVTRVEYIKQTRNRNFVIVDAGMNDLVRPALYGAWQDIKPIKPHQSDNEKVYDVAGPVCESSDFLGKDRCMNVAPGDLLAVDSAGAYGFSMSSNYNTRVRPAEVLVDGEEYYLIRRREKIQELFATEVIPELEKERSSI